MALEAFVEQRQQIGPARQPFVVNRQGADKHRLAARSGSADAGQAHHVGRRIGMQAQLLAGLELARQRDLAAYVHHVDHQAALRSLIDGAAETAPITQNATRAFSAPKASSGRARSRTKPRPSRSPRAKMLKRGASDGRSA